jgi:hypothetical protein
VAAKLSISSDREISLKPVRGKIMFEGKEEFWKITVNLIFELEKELSNVIEQLSDFLSNAIQIIFDC